MEYFLMHPGRAYSRDQLLEAVWGESRYVTPRTVDVHVRRLREQIEEIDRRNLVPMGRRRKLCRLPRRLHQDGQVAG